MCALAGCKCDLMMAWSPLLEEKRRPADQSSVVLECLLCDIVFGREKFVPAGPGTMQN